MTLDKRLEDATPHPAKLTAKDFWLLADSGAFANHARTELIEGEIWVVNSVHRWHARTLGRVHAALVQAIDQARLELEAFVAGSVSMSDDSVPEPDISIVAPTQHDSETIALEELRLAIEISDSTAEFDLGRKASLYARSGVPEYWVIHRDRSEVVQLWMPGPDGYRERSALPFGQRVTSKTIPDLSIETARL